MPLNFRGRNCSMPYAYYSKLSKRQKAIYRKSDAIESVTLNGAWTLQPLIAEMQEALLGEDRPRTERVANDLVKGIVGDLQIRPVAIKVLAARPSRSWGELHGLYEPADSGQRARISVWMRTAKHKKVVAFKTFLRTLLHELCHHLDYEYLMLEDSFHTEGFFKRESSLFYQLIGR